jgi:hypothetical protein
LVTSASFNVVNIVAGVVYTVALPFVALTTTYLYYDLEVRETLGERAPALAELPAEI